MKKFLTKKYILWTLGIIIVLAIGYSVFHPKAPKYTVAYTVANQDVKQTVIATGTVTSQSDLNLAFKNSGILSKINVKVGDKVRAGQVLAQLNESDALASIAQANAQVLSAQANLDKVLNGATNIDIQTAQVAVDNAYAALLNSTPQALPSNDSTSASVVIHGTYTGTLEGSYQISLYASSGGISYNVTGLAEQSGTLVRGLDAPIGHGLYINFSSDGFVSTTTKYTVTIPNTLASDYLTNYNAYKAALTTLEQKKAQARPEDITAAQASLASAKANLQIAQNAYSNNLIVAPIAGQITAVDVKLGEQVSALKEALILLDQTSLHVESNIPESSIGFVQMDQKIDMTLDAFGPDKHLDGAVVSIDPASTVVSGVIEFRVVSSLPDDPAIKPGMTVNLSIIIADKPDILAVPNRLVQTKNNIKFVSVLVNGKIQDRQITTGLVGDNYTEILSGLSVGDVLVTTIK
ncbi:MAG TPA: efflux RND transporter periplasmic adaptor subunit [Methylomirabilota bacterium]|nr:efflux RND transporter periplasmic adaptor subunit [Methylomirabilota bacterium]